jgi:hypothetical protein
MRSTREVLEDHLRLRAEGDLDADLARNVAEDIVILTEGGVFLGHDGVREQAQALALCSHHDGYEYDALVIEGEVGFLRWSATARDGGVIHDGADSYVVRDGKIVAQTIHYAARDEDGRRRSGPARERADRPATAPRAATVP